MNEELLHAMIRDIHTEVKCLSHVVRGDGTDANPGVLIKIDRLIQSSQAEKERRQKQEHRLWTAVSGLVLALFGAVLSWFHPNP